MTRKITLQLSHQRHFVANHHDGYRIRIDAVDADGLDNAIFVYQTLPPRGDNEERATWVGVCGPPDLEDLPVDTPDPDDPEGRFRMDYVDVVLRSRSIAHNEPCCAHAADAHTVWVTCLQEVRQLLISLAATDDMVAGESTTIEV